MNITDLVGKVVGDIGDKKRWRSYRSRVRALPAPYRKTVEALERYLMRFGAISRGDVLVRMSEDLADLFEQAAAAGTPIRDIVGDDPVAFAEDYLSNYSDGQWINKERTRLTETIDRAIEEETR